MKPIIERFLSKIRILENGCWKWEGWKNRNGYGQISLKGKGILTHRFIFEYYHGDINPKLTIDHLCNNTSCANPKHLKEATYKENILRGNGLAALNSRKTHCKQGHEFTPENIYITPINGRSCRTCENTRKRNRYQQNKTKELQRAKLYREKNRDKINLKKRQKRTDNKLKKQQVLL